MEGVFSNKNILTIFSKWWKQLVFITIAGVLVSFSATYLISPKYKSTAVVYPGNLGVFSEESYTEQMVQLLHSRDIADSLINKFHLAEHWGIAKDDKHYKSKLYDYYYDLVSIRKTPYESVEITVLDTDPQIACDMVNAVIFYYNLKVKSLHSIKLQELINVNKKQVDYWEQEITKSREIVEQILLKAGITNFSKTLDLFANGEFEFFDNRKYAEISLFKTKKSERKIITYKTKNLSADLEKVKNIGPIFYNHFRIYAEQLSILANFRMEKEQQEIENTKEVTYYSLVTEPYATDKKYSPMRIPIALLGGLSLLLLSFLVIAFVERDTLK